MGKNKKLKKKNPRIKKDKLTFCWSDASTPFPEGLGGIEQLQGYLIKVVVVFCCESTQHHTCCCWWLQSSLEDEVQELHIVPQ